MVKLYQGRTPGNQGLQEVIRSIPQLFRSGLCFPESTETMDPVGSTVYTLRRLWRRFPAFNLNASPSPSHVQNSCGIWFSGTHSLLEALATRVRELELTEPRNIGR